ncbi:MAG: bis(5'-nucleosyl)-tetraphosphatase (symmetrical) YqeK [Candidatus Margulisiibacteriota bacterium]
MSRRKDIIRKLKETLDPERFEHSLRVEKTAVALARRYRVSTQKASLAALLHDYSRKYSRKGLLKQARRFKLKIDPIRKFEPKLFHAELSALFAKNEFGVTSKQILGAIRKHTIGTPSMTKLEKIIYLADHIEEGRSFSGVRKIRSLAAKNLDKAILESSSNMLKFLLQKGLPIHPGTVQTRNYYLLKQ